MPIDLLSCTKKTSKWAFASPVINNILGNSIFVASIIALLMVVIIMIMYPAKSGTPFSIVIKMFVYMFFGSLLVVFLHDGVIKHMIEEQYETSKAMDFMESATMEGRQNNPAYSNLYQKIDPTQSNVPVINLSNIQSQPEEKTVSGDATSRSSGDATSRNLVGPRPPQMPRNPFQK